MDRLAAALTRTPLLTLVGAGGIGKTRLVQELVRRYHGQFPDGCWVVELASLADTALVPVAVSAAVGLRSERVQDLSSVLTEYLGRKQILLVLDNCEHLIEACAQLAANLLSKCPGLHILATSREPLLIAGETIWQVKPLEVRFRRSRLRSTSSPRIRRCACFSIARVPRARQSISHQPTRRP
jgi:predicted ATPase